MSTPITPGLHHLSARADADAQVPPPSVRWSTRVALPLGLCGGFALLFVLATWRALTPAIEVVAIPVLPVYAQADVEPSPVPANEAPALSREVAVQAAGWIEPSPFPVYATALVAGVIEEVRVLEGDRVKRGDVLASMVGDDARLQLRRAEAMVQTARAELDGAETTWEANIELRRAAAVARAELTEAAAAVALQQAEIRREEALLEADASVRDTREGLGEARTISQAEVTLARANHEARVATIEAARQQLIVLQARHERAQAEAEAAEARLRLRPQERLELERARARMLEAEVELAQAELRVERLDILAPMDGVVLLRHVAPGSKVTPDGDDPHSAHVIDLYDPAMLQVRVDVPLAEAGRVGVGQRAEVTVEALPGVTFEGEVIRISAQADIQKNTLEVKVLLHYPVEELRPEMLARIKLLEQHPEPAAEAAGPEIAGAVATRRELLAHIPQNALAGQGALRQGWVVQEFDGILGSASLRHIELLPPAADTPPGWLPVKRGLLPGDLLIISAPQHLTQGATVRVQIASGE